MEIKLRPKRIALERIKKNSPLSVSSNNYDYEDYLFKVFKVADDIDKSLEGKTIVKQKMQGVEIEFQGKNLIIIVEENILAEVE